MSYKRFEHFNVVTIKFKNFVFYVEKKMNVQFIFYKNLIYYQNEYNNRKRLCIFKSFK